MVIGNNNISKYIGAEGKLYPGKAHPLIILFFSEKVRPGAKLPSAIIAKGDLEVTFFNDKYEFSKPVSIRQGRKISSVPAGRAAAAGVVIGEPEMLDTLWRADSLPFSDEESRGVEEILEKLK